VGYDDFDISRIQDVPKESRIVVYCAVGYRSERIGEKLIKEGYTDVRNLYGGIFGCTNVGFPLFDEKGQTDRIHAYSRFWGIWIKKGTKVYD
jgi:hypothetical protein